MKKTVNSRVIEYLPKAKEKGFTIVYSMQDKNQILIYAIMVLVFNNIIMEKLFKSVRVSGLKFIAIIIISLKIDTDV